MENAFETLTSAYYKRELEKGLLTRRDLYLSIDPYNAALRFIFAQYECGNIPLCKMQKNLLTVIHNLERLLHIETISYLLAHQIKEERERLYGNLSLPHLLPNYDHEVRPQLLIDPKELFTFVYRYLTDKQVSAIVKIFNANKGISLLQEFYPRYDGVPWESRKRDEYVEFKSFIFNLFDRIDTVTKLKEWDKLAQKAGQKLYNLYLEHYA